MVPVKTKKCVCVRCNHVWKRKVSDVKACPRCRSPYWNLPRGVLPRGRPKKPDEIDLPVVRVRDL